jgi:hypothetical protein
MQIQMSTDNQDPRALLAKMQAEEDAAAAKVAELTQTNEAKRKALLEQLREADLKDVREKCELHGFTATDLRGVLKTKGTRKTAPRKTAARKTSRKKLS